MEDGSNVPWVVAEDEKRTESVALPENTQVVGCAQASRPGAIRAHLWVVMDDMTVVVNIVLGKHGLFAVQPSINAGGEWYKVWEHADKAVEEHVLAFCLYTYHRLVEQGKLV